MKQHAKKNLKRTLSVFMSLLMLMTAWVFVAPTAAAASADKLIARYFSTDSEWYDAVSGENQLDWQGGNYTSYQSDGSHYFNGTAYLKILTTDLFTGVSADTGMAFSYQWKADQTDAHRHIISLGANEYEGASNANSSFYVSATTSWMSSNKAPFVGYVNSNGDQLIGAYPAGAPDFASGVTYDITVSVSVANGVVFYINGVKYDAAYQLTNGASNLAAQQSNITEFLNAVSGWNNHYIGASRWADGNIKGYLKDLRIYNAALTDTEVILGQLDQNAVQTAFNNEDGTSFDAAANTFNAKAYHQGAETTGAYSNLVYSPVNSTSWSGVGGADQAVSIGRCDMKIAIPRNVVMVYDGVHEAYAPITLETRCNDTNGSSHIIHYVDYNDNNLYEVKNEFWQGYSKTWDVWAKDNINTEEQFAAYWHDGGSPGESPDSQRDSDSRFWWNIIQYFGQGNTTTYYDHAQNFLFNARTSYKQSGRQYKSGDVIACTDFYTINYQPIYSQLSNAAAVLQELKANEWMYTDESVANAKATLYLMAQGNPNNYDYGSGVDAQVQACATTIKQAKGMIDAGGLNLVKKQGTATFNFDDGTTQTITANYGDAITIPAVPAKDSDAQYHYTDGVWSPAATPGSAVMSDTYNKTFTATYTANLRSYTINWYDGDGLLLNDMLVAYGETPVYSGTTPTKTATAQYSYQFNGDWSPAVVPVTGEANYTAQFDSTTRSYTITWKNADGTVIDTTSVAYGETPTHAAPAVPASYDTVHYTYTFDGWTPEVVAVTGEAEYTATFTQTPNNYTITWKNADGTVIDTTSVAYGATPTHAAPAVPASYDTEHYTYTFDGWDPMISVVSGDATYTAQFTQVANTYTVKFFDLDNVQIGGDQTVAYGNSADAPALPTKAADATYHYAVDWNTNAWQNVQGDVNVYAVAEGTVHSFGETSYAWTDYTACTATRTCACGYSETANATISSAVDPAPTCSTTGLKTYTATFAEDWAETQTETETLAIDENAHRYIDTYNDVIRPVKDDTTGEWARERSSITATTQQ